MKHPQAGPRSRQLALRSEVEFDLWTSARRWARPCDREAPPWDHYGAAGGPETRVWSNDGPVLPLAIRSERHLTHEQSRIAVSSFHDPPPFPLGAEPFHRENHTRIVETEQGVAGCSRSSSSRVPCGRPLFSTLFGGSPRNGRRSSIGGGGELRSRGPQTTYSGLTSSRTRSALQIGRASI